MRSVLLKLMAVVDLGTFCMCVCCISSNSIPESYQPENVDGPMLREPPFRQGCHVLKDKHVREKSWHFASLNNCDGVQCYLV